MSKPALLWKQLYWRRPLNPDASVALLRQIASDRRSPAVVFEARADHDEPVQYLLGCAPGALEAVAAALHAQVGATVRTAGKNVRPATNGSGRLRASTAQRPLRANEAERVVRASLGALMRVRRGEHLVLQVVLGPRRIPLSVPTQSPSSLVAPWWNVAWNGNGGTIDSEKRTALRTKVGDHGFACTIRLGVVAGSRERRRALLLGLLAALRSSEAAGVQLDLRPEPTHRLDNAVTPWRWPLRLGVGELLPMLAWPLGDGELPGQAQAHPKSLPPVAGTTGDQRVIGRSTVPGQTATVSLSAKSALHHVHVVGPTGVGKSTLLANLILQDIADGRGVVVIEPKGDLVADVLARMPESRRDDVVVLDPTDSTPVGLNPLAAHGRRPELVADHVLAIFKQLYGRAIGPRSQDILYAGLLTLARREGTSLALLPLLLTNPAVRRTFTAGIEDPLTLEPFWATYENWSDAERAAATAPVMNKLRPLLRPNLRGIIGQPAPRFSVEQVLSERRILLVPLQRGLIGEEAASLLGSLIVAELWQVIQARARIPSERRHPVMIVLDEVQDYLHTGTDLGEALAQARGYGASFTLSHQYLAQLPKAMQAAVLANTRSRICFQLEAGDARVMAKGHSELEAADLAALKQYEVYASLFARGQVSPYASVATLPLGPVTADSHALRRLSRERWGQPISSVENHFRDLTAQTNEQPGATGRRRRSAP